MKQFLGPVLLLVWKDLLLEIRTKQSLVSLLVFALLVMLIFNFALNMTPQAVNMFAPGILWVTFIFVGMLAMSRAFVSEKERGSLDGLLLCPVSRDVIYYGKMIGIFLFMLVIEAMLLPIFAILFNFSAFSLTLFGIIVLSTFGFSVVGTLFAAMTVNTRAREVLLPVLFLPIIFPVLIAAVQGSAGAIGGNTTFAADRWIQLVAVFDIIFVVVCPWVFGLVVEE